MSLWRYIWVDKVLGVCSKITCFFFEYFADHLEYILILDGISFLVLLSREASVLSTCFTLIEVDMKVTQMKGNKSNGSGEFNFSLFKRFKDIFKKDIYVMLPYFVTLILKVDSLLSLREFRHISLLGSLYKLMEKALASRLVLAMVNWHF